MTWPLPHRCSPSSDSHRRPPSLSLLAAIAITVTWGGILVIARVEQMLAPELRWWGHAFVHLWAGTWAATVTVAAIRARRSGYGAGPAVRAAVTMAPALGAVVAITNLLEVVGAHPAMREMHDAVNRIGAPLGWLLLGNLALVLLLDQRRRAAARWKPTIRPPVATARGRRPLDPIPAKRHLLPGAIRCRN